MTTNRIVVGTMSIALLVFARLVDLRGRRRLAHSDDALASVLLSARSALPYRHILFDAETGVVV